jgi:hypothetical protein
MSTSTNPVYDTAPELSKHASEIRKLCKRVYNHIVEIGERLIECERLCKAEGKWLQWLEHEFGWSRKTADRFIDIANAADKVAKLATLVSRLAPSTCSHGLRLRAKSSWKSRSAASAAKQSRWRRSGNW